MRLKMRPAATVSARGTGVRNLVPAPVLDAVIAIAIAVLGLASGFGARAQHERMPPAAIPLLGLMGLAFYPRRRFPAAVLAAVARFYVQASNADIGLTPALATVLARQPGVRAVTEVRTTDATVAGAAHSSVDGVVPSQIVGFTSLGAVYGSLSSLSGGGLMVSTAVARAHHWRVGSVVTIGFGSYGYPGCASAGSSPSPARSPTTW